MVRCGAPSPRIETVTLPARQDGIYRVGVDFPEACRADVERAAFAVHVEGRGLSGRAEGVIDLRHFQPAVLDVRPASD